MTEVSGRGGGDERSVGELVRQMSEQVSHLIRDELRLARAELEQKGKRAGVGAGLTGGGGVLSLLGLGAGAKGVKKIIGTDPAK